MLIAVVAAALLAGCSNDKKTGNAKLDEIKKAVAAKSAKTEPKQSAPSGQDSATEIAKLVTKENLIRETGRALRSLSRSAKELRIDTLALPDVFADRIDIADIQKTTGSDSALLPFKTEQRTEYHGECWKSLFEKLDFFENAKFFHIRVVEFDRNATHVTQTGFEGLARSKEGQWWSVKCSGKISWVQTSSNSDWRISNWDLANLEIIPSPAKPFQKVTPRVFSQTEYRQVASSPQRALFLNVLRKGNDAFPSERLRNYFRHIPVGQHSAVSVVDINDDGLDDFYLSEQFRHCRLYVNKGDGKFVEEAKQRGLQQGGFGTSAIFADFDNDGDKDLFQGNSLIACQYFENVDGVFKDQTKAMCSFPLPSLASSLSAADFNNDGLLDVYVSTYGFPAGRGNSKNWMDDFLPGDEAEKVRNLIASPEHNRYLDATGPPNLLLINRGNKFEVSQHNEQLKVYRNTLQSSWSDFDNDGDVDLFVSNDFAQDYLFRNDGDAGFRDVTLEFGDDTMMGFGMGAAWGDVDLDGRRDLYISNMYSKAGLRIVDHFEGLDKRYARSANGNRLYLNRETGLTHSTSAGSAGHDVQKAGWSWGGQLADFNNDGYLDIYVASGYFTAPKILASDKDL